MIPEVWFATVLFLSADEQMIETHRVTESSLRDCIDTRVDYLDMQRKGIKTADGKTVWSVWPPCYVRGEGPRPS